MSGGHDHHDDHGHDDHGHDEHGDHGHGHGGHGSDAHEEAEDGSHEDEGHGHDEHGDHGHDHHDDHGHDEHGDHGHGGWDEEAHEEEEPLLEPAGIVNDLSPTEWRDPTVDLTGHFSISEILAVRHNDANRFDDVRSGEGAKIDLSRPRILKIAKYRTKKTSDILPRKECAPSLLAFVDKKRPVRPEPANVCDPIEMPEFAYDVRDLEPIPVPTLRCDVFSLPLPPQKRAFRYLKKRRKKILKSVLATSLVATVLIWSGIGAVTYAQTGVQKAYGELFALKTAAEAGNAVEFSNLANGALSRFSKLEIVFAPFSAAFDSSVLRIEKISTANRVIRGGYHLASAASAAGRIWADFSKETGGNPDMLAAFWSGSAFKATNFLRDHMEDVREIDAEISAALAEYSKIQSLGDPGYDEKFKMAVTALVTVQDQLRFVISHEKALMTALGHEMPQRYLVLNQNRDELRATGGFPGSAIFVEFYKWRLTKYEKKDIYYYDWHLFPYAEKAPPGLDRISEKWGLRDANYYPELKKDFETMDAFYQKSGGSSINGIVLLNQGFVVDLLEKYGPVRLEKVKKTVDARNFSMLMSVLVENKIAKTYSPKDILFEFAGEFEKILKEKKDFVGYLWILDKNAKNGEILAYSNDPEANALFAEIFPGEKNRPFVGNFAYPVFTSVSGNKSDRYAYRNFEMKSEPMEGCRVLNRFKMETEHRMTTDEKERVRGLLYDLGIPPEEHERQIFIQGNGDNRHYVRVYAPKGSKLSGKPPIQITVDDASAEYTVFAFYTATRPGEKTAAFFDYVSEPANCSKKPDFYAQPWLRNYNITTQ